ncbi:MAG: diacylglycerol kinase family lipid kinase [Sandaracinaceae bacterium]
MSAESPAWCAIVNPAAGGGRAGKRAPSVLARLRDEGIPIDAVYTEGPRDAIDLARAQVVRGTRRFLCVGGDGTTHEVLNGALPPLLAEGAERLQIGMLPLGTGNSFLRDFGITNAEEALRRLRRGRAHPVDALRVVHRDGSLFAFNLLGLGFAARAGALTNRRYKPLGTVGYVAAVIQSTIELATDAYPFSTDRAPRDARPALLLSFSNSRATGGGMQMAPRAEVDDGELDVIRIGPMPRGRFLSAFPSIFAGTHVERPEVEQSRARTVTFDLGGATVDCMIDGEVIPLALERIEVVPRAFDVVV